MYRVVYIARRRACGSLARAFHPLAGTRARVPRSTRGPAPARRHPEGARDPFPVGDAVRELAGPRARRPRVSRLPLNLALYV